MSNLKTLTTIAVAALFASPAFAQIAMEPDTIEDVPAPAVEDTLEPNFTAADLDQNGTLNIDEFVTFAVMRAKNGAAAYEDLVIGGEYTDAFYRRDADASGDLDLSELGASEPAPAELTLDADDTDIAVEPDLN